MEWNQHPIHAIMPLQEDSDEELWCFLVSYNSYLYVWMEFWCFDGMFTLNTSKNNVIIFQSAHMQIVYSRQIPRWVDSECQIGL